MCKERCFWGNNGFHKYQLCAFETVLLAFETTRLSFTSIEYRRIRAVGQGESRSLRKSVQALKKRHLVVLILIVPAILSLLAVWNESAITLWVQERDSALVVGVFMFLATLLHQRLQRLLIVTLCYGVAFLALRDILHVMEMPAPLSTTPIISLRFVLLITIAIFASLGAVTEALKANTLTARRYYTGAAALYFLQQGALFLYWQGSWQSVVLLTTGVICGLGCYFARYLTLSPEPEPLVEEGTEEQELEAIRHKLIALREWRDPDTEEVQSPAISSGTEKDDWGQAGITPTL